MIDILNINFLIFGLLLASLSGVTGYFYARLRLKRCEEELARFEAHMRRQRVDLQRLSYQESISRIHQSSGSTDIKSREALEAQLDQLRRDYSILEQESQFEQRLYREENQSLREELAELTGSPIEFRGALGRDLFEDAKEIEQLNEEELSNPAVEDNIPSIVETEDSVVDSASADLDDVFSETEQPDSEELSDPEEAEPPLASLFEEFEFHWTQEQDELSDLEPVQEAKEPVQDAFPVFRSFSDFVPQNDDRQSDTSTSSFSSSDSFTGTRSGSAHTAETRPNMESGAQDPIITSLIGLSPDQFALLSDLGYASSEKRAQLSPEEISRLSEIFRIPADFIRSNWMK